MDRVRLCKRLVAANDDEVFVVLVGRFVAEVMAACCDNAIFRQRVDHNNLVVDDCGSKLQDFLFKITERCAGPQIRRPNNMRVPLVINVGLSRGFLFRRFIILFAIVTAFCGIAWYRGWVTNGADHKQVRVSLACCARLFDDAASRRKEGEKQYGLFGAVDQLEELLKIWWRVLNVAGRMAGAAIIDSDFSPPLAWLWSDLGIHGGSHWRSVSDLRS